MSLPLPVPKYISSHSSQPQHSSSCPQVLSLAVTKSPFCTDREFLAVGSRPQEPDHHHPKTSSRPLFCTDLVASATCCILAANGHRENRILPWHGRPSAGTQTGGRFPGFSISPTPALACSFARSCCCLRLSPDLL